MPGGFYFTVHCSYVTISNNISVTGSNNWQLHVCSSNRSTVIQGRQNTSSWGELFNKPLIINIISVDLAVGRSVATSNLFKVWVQFQVPKQLVPDRRVRMPRVVTKVNLSGHEMSTRKRWRGGKKQSLIRDLRSHVLLLQLSELLGSMIYPAFLCLMMTRLYVSS